MSDAYLSSMSSKATEEPRADEQTEKPKSPKCVSSDSCSPDRCLRDRVLKEVGVTSTAFIGPAFPPETSKAKCDIEDSLSKFYKELEKLETPDSDNRNSEKDVPPLEPPTNWKSPDVPDGKFLTTQTSSETSNYQNNTGRTKPPWPHWYRNEPYHLKRPVLNCGSSVSHPWHHPPPPIRPPFPRLHRPPFHHQLHNSAYPNLQNPPPPICAISNNSETTNQYYQESILPTFPPPDVCIPPSQSFYEKSSHHFGRSEQGCYNTDSDSVNTQWFRDRREERSWISDDYERPQRFLSENEEWKQQHRTHNDIHQHDSPLVLILMRGLPGSGKTTLARELLFTGPSGVILSTDDYFAQRHGYRYDPGLLGAAHEWNQSRAKDALQEGRSPIIIDNTNLQAWEMKPYVQMALESGYTVDFCEPDTSWKFDPYELEKRNKHGVPQEKISQMMDRFSSPVSIDIVMNSEEPAHVNQRRRPEQLPIHKKQHFY